MSAEDRVYLGPEYGCGSATVWAELDEEHLTLYSVTIDWERNGPGRPPAEVRGESVVIDRKGVAALMEYLTAELAKR